MGLDDVTKNRAMQVGEVKSSLDPEQVEMTEDFWETMAGHYPEMLYWDAKCFDEKQIRYFISLLDKVIQDEVSGTTFSDEQIRAAESAREELLEFL